MIVPIKAIPWASGRILKKAKWLKMRQIAAGSALVFAVTVYFFGITALILLQAGSHSVAISQTACWSILGCWTLVFASAICCCFWRSSTIKIYLAERLTVIVETRTVFWHCESEYQIPNEARLRMLSRLIYEMPDGKKFALSEDLRPFLPGQGEFSRLSQEIMRVQTLTKGQCYEFVFDGGRQFAARNWSKFLAFLVLTLLIIITLR